MSYIEELKELGKLRDDGILTDDEFNKKKEEILSKDVAEEKKEKKGFFSRYLTDTLQSTTEKVLDILSPIEKGKNELNELQKLYKDGIIAESEYRKKLKGIKEKGGHISGAAAELDESILNLRKAIRAAGGGKRKVLSTEEKEQRAKEKEQEKEQKAKLYRKNVLKFLKKHKGKSFTAGWIRYTPFIPYEIEKVYFGRRRIDVIEAGSEKQCREILRELSKEGVINEVKKGRSTLYYFGTEDEKRLEDQKFDKIKLEKDEQKKKEDEQKKKKMSPYIKKYGRKWGKIVFVQKTGRRDIKKGMTSSMVRDVKGKPGKVKKNTYKNTIKESWFYNERTTRQNTTVYGIEVKLENKVVIGIKDLE